VFTDGSCKCGGPYPYPFPNNRIIGGREVSPHSIPFQVALYYNGTFFCGGSLISPNYVLTAAHCVPDIAPLLYLKVVVGEHNLNIIGDGEQTFSVIKITVHPLYNGAISRDYDIAIFQILPSVNIPTTTANVGIVCLPPDVTQTFEGAVTTVSGWGLTSNTNTVPSCGVCFWLTLRFQVLEPYKT
jgi:secreted trypsin-like serine protease